MAKNPRLGSRIKGCFDMKNEAKIFFDVPFEIRWYVFEIHDFNSLSKLP